MKPTPGILGVSHLVVAARDLEAAEAFARSLGHDRRGQVDAGANPPSKSSVVDGALSPTYDMRLLASRAGLPSLELLREGGEGPRGRAPRFEALLSAAPLTPAQARAALDAPSPFPGFRSAGGASRVSAVARCPDLDAALALWEALGHKAERPEPGLARVAVHGLTPSSRMDLFFVRDGSSSEPGWLNREGLVCLSFFCRDADALRAALSQRWSVTECFDLSPFGRPLRLFFARGAGGELYEFLAVGRPLQPSASGGAVSCRKP